MSKEKSDIDWDLIAKYLAGETDGEEENVLADRMNADETGRRYFADLQNWWNRMGRLIAYGKIDVDTDFQKVKKRLAPHDHPTRKIPLTEKSRRNGRFSFLKYAAATVAFLIIVGAAYFGSGALRNQNLVFNQIIVPNGHRSQMVLADGTSVWLNSGSSLQFPASFEDDQRLVKLEGEAYFEVTENKKKPFIVQTLGMKVKVHGTSFNVMSYADDDLEEVTLLDGLVTVKELNSKNELRLQPGQKISYVRKSNSVSGPVPADMNLAVAWRDGKLFFENEPFGEIAKKLERRYGVTIHIQDKSIEKEHYRGAFRKETLEQAIKAIQLTAKFQYKIEEDIVTIYK